MDSIVERLEIIDKRLRAAQPSPLRLWSQSHILDSKRRGQLVSGPRGVGKTTFLLASAPENTLYFSADNLIVANHSIAEISEAAFSRGFDGVIVEEVHNALDWSKQLKSLYEQLSKPSYLGK